MHHYNITSRINLRYNQIKLNLATHRPSELSNPAKGDILSPIQFSAYYRAMNTDTARDFRLGDAVALTLFYYSRLQGPANARDEPRGGTPAWPNSNLK
jgi:hypothetical protein